MALISTEKEHASGRIVCIVAGVLATCSVGPILGYNVYVDAFKAHFKLSQVTAEMISSFAYVSSSFGFVAGIISTKWSHRHSVVLGMVFIILSYGLLWGSTKTTTFHENHSYLFIVYFAIAGQGAALCFFPATDVNKRNWSRNHHAKVITIIHSAFQLAPAALAFVYSFFFVNGHVTDVANQNIGGFFLFLWITLTLFSIVAVVFLRNYTEPVYDTLNEQADTKSPELSETVSENKQNFTNTIASEKMEMIPLITDEDCDEPRHLHQSIKEGFQHVDTHLLLWGLVISMPSGFVFLNNITVMLESFRQLDMASAFVIAVPLIALAVKLAVVYVSDKYNHKISRVSLGVVMCVPPCFLTFLCIFLGDHTALIGLTFTLSVCGTETNFGLLPLALSERFKPDLFYYVFSMGDGFPAIVVIVIQLILGSFYEAQITGDGHICYGLQCFTYSFILLFIQQAIGIVLLGLYCYRQRRHA